MKKLLKTVLILLGILAAEYIAASVWIHSKESALQKQYVIDTNRMRIRHEMEKRNLDDEYHKNIYLATGVDAYQRIYNTKEQSITDLIELLAEESFPDQWKCEVKVDEFTNFLLMVQTSVNDSDNLKDNEYDFQKLIEYISPVMTYTANILKNICVFDSKHKCYLFFDEKALGELYSTNTLTQSTLSDIKRKGVLFTRYNSVKIDFKQQYGHIFVPAIIFGDGVEYECTMMLDTGASMTVISLELAQKTGNEDLNLTTRKTFSTANGLLSCPVINRNILAGGVGGIQSVAVNLKDDSNLLGINFFQDKNYIIDTSSNCIYVWSKSKSK